jgi:hypothetical protein
MLNLTRKLALIATLLIAASPVAAQSVNPSSTDPQATLSDRDLREFRRIMPGTYTNAEQVAFQGSRGVPEEDRVMGMTVVVERAGQSILSLITWEDGRTLKARHDHSLQMGVIRADAIRNGRVDCSRTVTRVFDSFHAEGCEGPFVIDEKGMILTTDGVTNVLRRARPFTCWASPRKADGSYAFYNDLVLHDQGGRVWIDATADHPRVGLKLRNVEWPTGVNRDSMALYTYQGTDEDYSPAYVWADPEAERLAINTRWLQASCTQGDAVITPNLNLRPGDRD